MFWFLASFRGFDLKCTVNKQKFSRLIDKSSTRFKTEELDVSWSSPAIMSSSKIYLEDVNIRVKARLWQYYRISLLKIEYPVREPDLSDRLMPREEGKYSQIQFAYLVYFKVFKKKYHSGLQESKRKRTLPKNRSRISTYRWMISKVSNSLSSSPIWQMKKSDA